MTCAPSEESDRPAHTEKNDNRLKINILVSCVRRPPEEGSIGSLPTNTKPRYM